MPQTAIVIGLPDTCRRLERQLDLLPRRPVSLGWVVAAGPIPAGTNILGGLDGLETIVARRRPDLALVTLPGAMGELVTAVRTRLRRLGVPDRFMPTLEDQLAGVGPRSRLEVEPGALLGRPARRIDEAAVARLLAGRRVLITGAGGTIGGELARIVCRYEPASLTLVERSENALFEIDRQVARLAPGLAREALLHDVVDAASTMTHFRRRRPQLVFHAAAHKHVPMMESHPAAAVDNNLFGTKSVADAADAVAAERFVLISTDKAVNPRSIMGATKRLAELYVQDLARRSATRFAVVRFGNVLGSTGSVLDVWSRELAEGGPLTVTDPRMTRYFMTIPEAAALVAQAAALLASETAEAALFLLNMGEPVFVLDLARRFIERHGFDPRAVGIAFTGARPGEKLHEELAYDTETLRPTTHPDIRVWPAGRGGPDPGFVDSMIDALTPARRDPDAAATIVRTAVAGGLRTAAA